MNIYKLLLLVALVLSFTFHAGAKTNGITYYGKAHRVKVKSMSDAYCVKIHEGFSVCKGNREEWDDFSTSVFFILQSGKIIKTWSFPYMADSSFEVLTGDLDGNGVKEIIISDYYIVSNMFSHVIHIVSPYMDKPSIATMFMDEFGVNGSFVPNPKTNEIFIMSCNWRLVGVDNKGEGGESYLMGTFIRYKDGKLVPAFEKKNILQKERKGFTYKRLDTTMNKNKPALLLQGKPKEIADDPFVTFKNIVSVQYGVVENVEIRKEDPALRNDPDLRDDPYRKYDPMTKFIKTGAINIRLESGENQIFDVGRSEPNSVTLGLDYGFSNGKVRLSQHILELYDVFDTLESVKVQYVIYKNYDRGENKTIFF